MLLDHERLFRTLADAFVMPELRHEVHSLFASTRAGRADKQAVCVRESGIQRRDQVVLQGSPHFGILPVLPLLPVAGLQHQPYIFLREVLRQGKPVVKAVVCQLYGVFFVGLGSS